jgi:polyferredoxin
MDVWSFLLFVVVSMAGSLWLGYVVGVQRVGREAAARNLRASTPWLILQLLSITAIPSAILLFGMYRWINFYIIFVEVHGVA